MNLFRLKDKIDLGPTSPACAIDALWLVEFDRWLFKVPILPSVRPSRAAHRSRTPSATDQDASLWAESRLPGLLPMRAARVAVRIAPRRKHTLRRRLLAKDRPILGQGLQRHLSLVCIGCDARAEQIAPPKRPIREAKQICLLAALLRTMARACGMPTCPILFAATPRRNPCTSAHQGLDTSCIAISRERALCITRPNGSPEARQGRVCTINAPTSRSIE